MEKSKRRKRINGIHADEARPWVQAATDEPVTAALPLPPLHRTLDPRSRRRRPPAVTPVPPFLQDPPGS